MSFQIGWAHVLALVVACAVAYRSRRLRGIALFAAAIAAGSSLFMLTWAQPIWDRLPIVQKVQFPWRFLMVVGTCTSLAAGIVAAFPSIPAAGLQDAANSQPPLKGARVRKRPRRDAGGPRSIGPAARIAIPTVLVILLVAASVPYLKARGGDGKDADFTPEAIRRQYFGELKFQPKEVEALRFVPEGPRAEIVGADGRAGTGGTATIVEESTHRTVVDVDAPEAATLRLHLFDTPGWSARAGGASLAVRAEPRTALVLVDLPAGRRRVELRFTDTTGRRVAWILSLVGALAALGAILVERAGSRTRAQRGLRPVDSTGTSP
jgi:hypothetical protein